MMVQQFALAVSRLTSAAALAALVCSGCLPAQESRPSQQVDYQSMQTRVMELKGLLHEGQAKRAIAGTALFEREWLSAPEGTKGASRNLMADALLLRAFAMFQTGDRDGSYKALVNAMAFVGRERSLLPVGIDLFEERAHLVASLLGDSSGLDGHKDLLGFFCTVEGGPDLLAADLEGKGADSFVWIYRSDDTNQESNEFAYIIVCRRRLDGAFVGHRTKVDAGKYYTISKRANTSGGGIDIVLSLNARFGPVKADGGELHLARGLSEIVLRSDGNGPLRIVSSSVRAVDASTKADH